MMGGQSYAQVVKPRNVGGQSYAQVVKPRNVGGQSYAQVVKPRNVGGQSYAQVVKRNPYRQNINQRSLSKRNSLTNIQRDDARVQSNQLNNKINDLERELNKVRETQRQHPSKTHQTNLAENNSNPLRQSKETGSPALGTQGQDKQTQHRNQRSTRIHINSNGNFRRIRETIQRASKYKSDPFGNVINLSNFKFRIPVCKLLGKNLNFCPTPGAYNKNIFKNEIEFYRRLKLRAHFGNDNRGRREITEEEIFKPRSNWEPKQIHHTVNTFCEAITRETQNQTNGRKPLLNNLTEDEIEAMNELKSR